MLLLLPLMKCAKVLCDRMLSLQPPDGGASSL